MKGGGIIQNTAGEGILNVFVCARINMQRREMFPDKKVDDLTPEEKDSTFNADSSKFVVYMSAESHFSGTRVTETDGSYVTKTALFYMSVYLVPCTYTYILTSWYSRLTARTPADTLSVL